MPFHTKSEKKKKGTKIPGRPTSGKIVKKKVATGIKKGKK